MLTTGVDAKNVRNIVLLRSIGSMVEFKQIIGRGTRVFEGKDYFTIIDFTGATNLFYDEKRTEIKKSKPDFPEQIPLETWKAFAADYAENFSLDGEVTDRFDQLKLIGKKYGFAGNNAEFKEGGFVGKVGDLAMFLRIQLC